MNKLKPPARSVKPLREFRDFLREFVGRVSRPACPSASKVPPNAPICQQIIRRPTLLQKSSFSALLAFIVSSAIWQLPTVAQEKSPDATLSAAIDYLCKQQADDGGWHSEFYGALRPGAASTCLTLYALSHCPPELLADHRARLLKARDFLLPQIAEYGYVSNPDGPDYSTYSSAMLLVANERLRLDLNEETKRKLVSYLLRAQIGKRHGYEQDDADFGGWDLMGWAQSPRTSAGTNVSVSSFALEAISLFPDEKISSSKNFAEAWLARCQNTESDGGFYFHPRRDHDGNKAGWGDNEKRNDPKSYGTATCDGLRCLTFLCSAESRTTDKRILQAVKWIEHSHRIDQVPGFEVETSEMGWRTGLRYYYFFSLSKVLPLLSQDTQLKLAGEISAALEREQQAAGFWQNENARMREDDPLIATNFCVIALANIRRIEQDQRSNK